MKPMRENAEACSFQRTEWVITVAALKGRNAFLFRVLFLVKALVINSPLMGSTKSSTIQV